MNNVRWSVMVSLSIFVGSILTIGLSPIISNAQSFQTAELDIDFTSSYTVVWTDSGSGASADVSFWRPEPPAGWFRVGHHLKRGYGNPTESTIIVRERVNGALVRPFDYSLIWDDTGSGATNNVSVWRPACPGGYRAMGDLTSKSHAKPALDEVVCVREAALAATNSGNEIWNDTGSGATRDFAAWEIVSPAPDMNFNYASRGLFFGNPSHSRPPASSIGGLWAVKVPRAFGGGAQPVTASGSSADQQFWDAIKNSQRTQDYQSYLAAFPNGQFAANARFKISSLSGTPTTTTGTGAAGANSNADEQFWNLVKNSNKAQDFESYLAAFPSGQFASLARFNRDRFGGVNATPSNSGGGNGGFSGSGTGPVGGGSGGSISVDEQFWNNVKNSNNARDYQSYLDNFPNGQFASLARFNRDRLGGVGSPPSNSGGNIGGGRSLSVDEQFWNNVKNSNNARDYQSYLDNFPNGQFVALARFNRDRLSGSSSGGGSTIPPLFAPTTSPNAAMLNKSAAETRTSLPLTLGQVQLFAAESHCQSGCQVSDNTDSVVISAKTPSLSKQNMTIGQIEQFLKPQLLKTFCGTPEQRSGISMGVTAVDMFNQPYGNFFLVSRDCGGTTGTTSTTVTKPPVTGFQQVISSAQPGSISELARARRFFVVSSDFSIKSKITAAILKQLPQMQAASTEQQADFLIGFELTDRTTGLVTPNESSNPNLRGELIVFTMIPAMGNSPERARILFRVTKERGFGVFSATPDESAAKEFAKQFAKVII